MDDHIQVRQFPSFALPFEEMKDGCRAKLAMFAPGTLLPDVPAIFFDLDTMIMGDVSLLAREVATHGTLFMLKNHAIPFWRVQRQLRPLLGKRYYFGNSSVVGFIPKDFEFIYSDFNKDISLVSAHDGKPSKHLATDERYMSYAARDRLRVWSLKQVTAFHREFMSPALWLAELRKKLPWIARRRRNLTAITFIGSQLKPQEIGAFEPAQIIEQKRRKVRWSFNAYQTYWLRALTPANGQAASQPKQARMLEDA